MQHKMDCLRVKKPLKKKLEWSNSMQLQIISNEPSKKHLQNKVEELER
jgi:hypothetical protein